MALRFDASTDGTTVAISGTTAGNGFSVCGWVYLSVDQNTYSGIVSVEQSTGPAVGLFTKTDGTQMTAWDTAGNETSVVGIQMVVGNWYRFAVTALSGTTALYYSAAGGTGVMTKATGSQTQTTAPDKIRLGGSLFGDFWNGRIANIKAYNAQLTDAEVEVETSQYQPSRTTGLLAWYPLLTDLIDYSGNGRTMTAGSTATAVEDGPPLRWARSRSPRVRRAS